MAPDDAERETFEGRPPPFPVRLVGRLVASLAVLAGAVTFLAMRSGPVRIFDPIDLVTRLVVVATAARLALHGHAWGRYFRDAGLARRARLVLEPERLILVRPEGNLERPREAVVDAREAGTWQGRRADRRDAPVHVVFDDGTTLTLPAIFAGSPGQLAEALTRWRGVVAASAPPEPDPRALATKTYDDAVQGRTTPGTAIVPLGKRWLLRGPYASLLFLVVLGERALAEGIPLAFRLTFAILVAVCLAIPIGWLVLGRKIIAPRRGAALVVTPAETLLRTTAGVLRRAHRDLVRVDVESRPGWSLLEGLHAQRALVLRQRDGSDLRYDEGYLRDSAEAVAVLLDAYRRGLIRSAG